MSRAVACVQIPCRDSVGIRDRLYDRPAIPHRFLGPKQFNLDIGLFRRFPLTERAHMEFRAEAFNFTNTPHFANPQGSTTSSQFGEIRGTRNTGREGIDQRIFRFALRFAF
jgi:hypothetical protein